MLSVSKLSSIPTKLSNLLIVLPLSFTFNSSLPLSSNPRNLLNSADFLISALSSSLSFIPLRYSSTFPNTPPFIINGVFIFLLSISVVISSISISSSCLMFLSTYSVAGTLLAFGSITLATLLIASPYLLTGSSLDLTAVSLILSISLIPLSITNVTFSSVSVSLPFDILTPFVFSVDICLPSAPTVSPATDHMLSFVISTIPASSNSLTPNLPRSLCALANATLSFPVNFNPYVLA